MDKCPNPGVPGEGLDGAFAEYVVVPNPALGRTLFRVPENLDWKETATIEPISVACYAVKRAHIQTNETLVILGAGMIGQGIVQVCKAMGARKVIASEPSAIRLAMVSKLGADTALNPKETNPIEAVKQAASGEMADVVFECSGFPAAFRQATDMLRPFGRIIQVGMFEENLELNTELTSLMFAFRNMTLRGSGGLGYGT
jgi:threonine dehydrogenase-like Zn-dependent dehydrogenase